MANNNNTRVSAREIIRSMNYNVKLIFAFNITRSLGGGIWMGSVLSLYISLFAEGSDFLGLSSNEILGLTSAASGLTMTLFVFPAGYLADKFKRDIILKLATPIGIAGIAFLAFGQSIVYILISMLLWGLFNAFINPASESIFADSVESGYRSKIYSWNHFVRQAAMAIGPFINIGLFALFGNVHNLTSLRNVMFVGFAVSLIAIVILFMFKDTRSLGEESESIAEEVTIINETSRFANMDSKRAAKLIPLLMVSGNVIIGIGAGMTIKYFPIFFRDYYTLEPIPIQAIMGATALATGILAVLAQKISLKLGRVQTIFSVQFIATACLLIIVVYPPLGVLIPIFIARGSFMNAAQPLSRSILMDIIPKNQRGKWNSVEAIAWGLFWNVSAFIGGFLVGDNNNFNLCFIITTFVYILGLVPIIVLMPLVGKEREAKDIELDREGVEDVSKVKHESENVNNFKEVAMKRKEFTAEIYD